MLISSLRNFPGSDIISSCCDVLCPAQTRGGGGFTNGKLQLKVTCFFNYAPWNEAYSSLKRSDRCWQLLTEVV